MSTWQCSTLATPQHSVAAMYFQHSTIQLRLAARHCSAIKHRVAARHCFSSPQHGKACQLGIVQHSKIQHSVTARQCAAIHNTAQHVSLALFITRHNTARRGIVWNRICLALSSAESMAAWHCSSFNNTSQHISIRHCQQ